MFDRKKINILDESIAKKIAAGEIVENPASVVKELLENAIDAKANNISIEIKNGGRDFISISDNGTGIGAEDTKLAFIRHATSKISTIDDLYSINQMGFRGEALYSISAVSKVTLITKAVDENIGSFTHVEGGIIGKNQEYGCPDGTTIIVEDLFYNTPARKKFMKKSSVETGAVSNIIQKYILAYPDISFKFINNGKVIYYTNGDSSLKNAVFTIFGRDAAENIVEFATEESNGISFSGCVGNKNLLGKTRSGQAVFINKRYVKDKIITAVLEEMYSSNLMKHTYPFFIVNVTINSLLVDVNVHPQKLNVIFSNPEQVISEVKTQLKPYLDMINGQIMPFDSEKTSINAKLSTENSVLSTQENQHKDSDVIDEINKTIEKENIEIPEEYYDGEDASSPNLTYKLSDFNYKAALVLDDDDNGSSSNFLKQTSAAVNLQYEQTDFKKLAKSYTIIGAAFSGYLLIECGDTICIFDQHAAHERLNYENYLEILDNSSPVMQRLLIPQTIDLPYDDILIIQENIDAFTQVGYLIEIDDLSVSILGVPVFLGQPRMESFFKEILANLKTPSENESSTLDKLISMSCKKAVKITEKLSDKEIKRLIDLVLNNDVKLTCPHGRPFVSVITKKQLEKRFGRIV